MGHGYAEALAAGLYALWSVAIVLMMVQCAQVSRDGGINPVFIYGVFGGIMYALHDVGFLGGRFLETVQVAGLPPLALITIGAVYLLGIMYFVGQGSFRRALASGAAEEIELLALTRRAPRATGAAGGPAAGIAAEGVAELGTATGLGATGGAGATGAAEGAAGLEVAGLEAAGLEAAGPGTTGLEGATGSGAIPQLEHTTEPESATARESAFEPGPVPTEGAYRDRLSKRMAAVREFYGLSARETEVAELIARGNTMAHIAELLFVSENTVRTHAKHIYVKLDIHKRQELIDLVEHFEPEGR